MPARLIGLVAALALGAGCAGEGAGGAASQAVHDGGAVLGTDGSIGGDGDASRPAPAADAGAADAAPECARDDDCGDSAWCDPLGVCQPAAEMPTVPLPADGVTRAAAARFDITPAYLEPWIDRAGGDCPKNRAGRFDGRLDEPDPAEACTDGFDDADGDGLFDAVWLGGEVGDRPAMGVDNANPPGGRVLVLTRNDDLWVLVTLDVYAVGVTRARHLARGLRLRFGLPESRIAVHATGSRSGPDAHGLGGPSLDRAPGERPEALRRRLGGMGGLLEAVPFASGTGEAWFGTVEQQAAAALSQAVGRLAPVRMRVARVPLPMEPDPPLDGPIELPDANDDGVLNAAADRLAWRERPVRLARDDRLPVQRDTVLRALALDSAAGGEPVTVLLSWGAAPATRPPDAPLLSAEFPGVARQWLEAAAPGAVALWLGGAADDRILAGDRAFVPEIDESGQYLDRAGFPAQNVEQAAAAADPTHALGVLLASRAWAALEDAESRPVELAIAARSVWVPITNPRFGLAARLGVLPGLGDWLTGRTATQGWSSGAATPACGGLGCLRYRLDRVDLGGLTLLTTPGALDDAFVRGRAAASLWLPDARNLADLDADGVPDAEDPELHRSAGDQTRRPAVRFSGPANPQVFDAIEGLESESVWVMGRTNGGVGALRAAHEHLPVFEGQLDPLRDVAADPMNARVDLCLAGYPCEGHVTLGDLVERTFADQPDALADLPGAHELWLIDTELPDAKTGQTWRVEAADGTPRTEGDDLELGPGNRAFTASIDLVEAGVVRGDALVMEDGTTFEIGGVVPIVMSRHPNAAGIWEAEAPDGGDLVYNAACELLFDGVCPHPREVVDRDDPNRSLPGGP